MKEKISVVVITRNEEKNIAACLESVSWAEEVVIVDSGSTDATLDICRRHNAKIFTHSIDDGLNFNKNLGNDKATGDWVMSLDADERATPGLAEEIRTVLQTPADFVAYKIPRRNYFLGKPVTGAGWWPDANIRLFRKGKAKWAKGVHDVMESAGPVGELKNPIDHFSYRSLEEYFRKFNFYTSVLAGEEMARGKKITPLNFAWHFFLNPAQVFLRKYFWMGGWRDGFRGFFISCSAACVVWTVAAKIWEGRLKEGGLK